MNTSPSRLRELAKELRSSVAFAKYKAVLMESAQANDDFAILLEQAEKQELPPINFDLLYVVELQSTLVVALKPDDLYSYARQAIAQALARQAAEPSEWLEKATRLMGALNLPAIAAALDGGEFRGVITKPDGTHCAVLLLGIANKDANQKDQRSWAAKLGGQLATKAVINLIIATMNLPDNWYWLDEEYGSSHAWYCDSLGHQGIVTRCAEGGAVAVRRVFPSVL